MDIATQVDRVLAERHEKLPSIRATRTKLETLDKTLAALETALETVGRHPRTPAELRSVIAGADLKLDQEKVRQALNEVERVEARFSRKTVNLGMSGQARVGKSTLLQALSGLDDDAIPTGTGAPVTAVRSRILSSPERIARLQMHSWESFRDEVLAPYHADLVLGEVPASTTAFRSRQYPEPNADDENSRNVMLFRLRGMRDSLSSYERLLTGNERVVSDFSKLRSWVAYPEDDQPSRIDNLYLAVRQAVIECPFPHEMTRSIGLVDLPGLGEIAASAETHHVQGLREEVDFVLLVKRANEGMAYWTKQDAQARKLIDQARKPIRNTSDFIGIVSNEGCLDPATLKKMLYAVPIHANAGLENSPIQMFSCDGKDPASVRACLLEPVLKHLAERLPGMDAELLDHARGLAKDVANSVGVRLQALDAGIARTLPDAPGTAEMLYIRTTKLRQMIALDLKPVRTRRFAGARGDGEDANFIASIRAAHAEIRAWADNALGVGPKTWREEALGRFAQDNSTTSLVNDELNRIRVHIDEVFCRLDEHLSAQTTALFDEIGTVFVNRCGRLAIGRTGQEGLEILAEQLSAGDEPCPQLERAVRNLLDLKVSYRSHFHPVVRAKLDMLDEFRDPVTNKRESPVAPQDPTEAGAEVVLQELMTLTIKASATVRDELLRGADLMDKILHAATEQFEDSFIRSGTSLLEFARFARSWRDELFPGEFDTSGTTRFDILDIKQALGETRRIIDNLQIKATNE